MSHPQRTQPQRTRAAHPPSTHTTQRTRGPPTWTHRAMVGTRQQARRVCALSVGACHAGRRAGGQGGGSVERGGAVARTDAGGVYSSAERVQHVSGRHQGRGRDRPGARLPVCVRRRHRCVAVECKCCLASRSAVRASHIAHARVSVFTAHGGLRLLCMVRSECAPNALTRHWSFAGVMMMMSC